MQVPGGGTADHVQEPLCLSSLGRQRLTRSELLRGLLRTGLKEASQRLASDRWPHRYH